MRRPNFSDKQLAAIADRWRAGESQVSIARDLGTTQSTIWYWTTAQKISPKTVAENKRLKRRVHSLERELKVLKIQRQAAASLLMGFQPSKRRRSLMVPLLRAAFKLTRVQGNAVVGLSKIAGHVSLQRDRALIDLMWQYIARHPYAGFKTLFSILRHKIPGSRHSALDIYNQAIASIEVRAKIAPKQRSPVRHMPVQTSPNDMWSVDFMFGKLSDESGFWIFTGIDDFNREAIIAKVAERRSAKLAVEAIDSLRQLGRVPLAIRSDNGREFKSNLYKSYLLSHEIERKHTRSYIARDNSYAENLNRLIRYEVLERHVFRSMRDAQTAIDEWLLYYNYARPQEPLGDLSPMQYKHLTTSRSLEVALKS